MDLEFTPEERAFQDEVRAFIDENYPAEIRAKTKARDVLVRDDFRRWHQILAEKGWVAPHWPVEHGGTDWTVVQHFIFNRELARAGTPRVMPFGVKMVGPVIIAYGSDAQKKKYLPRIYSGEDWWCQGYSEPGAGSDLAGLATKAVLNGDHYLVNGTKTWTSFAHYANKMFCLVRTAEGKKPQESISFLLIDMDQPGVDVRPIVTIDGAADVNMVYLSDVKVPVEDRVGEENRGWTYAKFLLGNERMGIAGVATSKQQLQRLREISQLEKSDGAALLEDQGFAGHIAQMDIELSALEYTEYRYLTAAAKGAAPGPEASMLKIRGTEIHQRIVELTMQAVGYYAQPFTQTRHRDGRNMEPAGPDYASARGSDYFGWRKSSIYGGTNEIQRNIIAKMVLGL